MMERKRENAEYEMSYQQTNRPGGKKCVIQIFSYYSTVAHVCLKKSFKKLLIYLLFCCRLKEI